MMIEIDSGWIEDLMGCDWKGKTRKEKRFNFEFKGE